MEDLAVFIRDAANNLDDARRYGDHVPVPRSEEAARQWLTFEVERVASEDRFLVVTHGETVVGSITTYRCDPRAGVFWAGFAVFPEYRRHGYASEAMRVLIRAYFDELRYHKVQTKVHADNEASLRLHEKLGFTEEGRLREAAYTEGRRIDDVLFGMTAPEFRERWPRP